MASLKYAVEEVRWYIGHCPTIRYEIFDETGTHIPNTPICPKMGVNECNMSSDIPPQSREYDSNTNVPDPGRLVGARSSGGGAY